MTKIEMEQVRKTWAARVAEFRNSSQSATAWCRANQLKTHPLHYWLQKFQPAHNPPSPTSQWISVQLEEPAASVQSPLLVRVGQAVIEVKFGYDARLLEDVVRTLSALC